MHNIGKIFRFSFPGHFNMRCCLFVGVSEGVECRRGSRAGCREGCEAAEDEMRRKSMFFIQVDSQPSEVYCLTVSFQIRRGLEADGLALKPPAPHR